MYLAVKYKSSLKLWQRLAILAILCLFVVSLVGQTVSAQEADEEPAKEMNEEFYAGNDILFYDPNAQVCVSSGASPSNNGGEVAKDFSLGSGTPERPVNLAKNLMSDYGLTVEQAVGIVGNFMHESGGEDLPPDMNQGMTRGAPHPSFAGGKAYGWAQWDGPRKKAFVKYGADNGYTDSMSSPATDASNYAYLKYELDNTETSTMPAVKNAESVQAAVIAFEANFERAGKPAIAVRTALANKLLGWYNGDGGGSGGGGSGSVTCDTGGGGTQAGSFGNTAFPLAGNKSVVNNPGMFKDGTTDQGGHPYTSYDILADTGVKVNAFIDGTVTHISNDRCPGRLISIYNKEHNVVTSYLHLSMNTSSHVKKGDKVKAGDKVGVVGTTREGCTVPHLHIDVVKGDRRVGCSRLNCPAKNQALFVDIGPDLFKTFEALPG